MKQVTLALVILLSVANGIFSQTVPSGMKYQAVARDLKGEILANQAISLEISLVSQKDGRPTPHYTEVHDITTNQLGLFDLVIGGGKVSKGVFKDVPWSTQDIWMQVAIKDKGSANFSTISNSKLLAVPYAFHAATASELAGNKAYRTGDVTSGATAASAGVPSANWSLKGNRSSNPAEDKLGVTDYVDLVLVTNNIERLRITKDGDINLKNNLTVNNNLTIVKSADIGENLTVKNNVLLNTNGLGTTDIKGAATLQKTLTVTGAADLKSSLNAGGPTTLKNTLSVDGATDLKSTLNTAGATTLKSTLTVDGATVLKDALTTVGATNLMNSLAVDGATDLKSSLNASGATTLKNSLTVDGITTLTNTTESSSSANGALVIAGGAGITKNLNVGGSSVFGGGTNFSGAVNILNETQSDNATTGALKVAGGAGVGKNLNVGGNSSVTGNANITGNLNVNTNKFNVAGATGNTTVAGTLGVTGATTLTGAAALGSTLDVAGNVNVNTNKFNVAAATGNTTVAGTLGVTGATTLTGAAALGSTLDVTGNVNVNTNKFNVAASTGNTSVAGTLGVTGGTSLNNTLSVGGVATFNNSVVLNKYLTTKGLNVKNDSTGYLATFENTNNANGDGIKIKLGKTHPMWNGSWVEAPNYSANQFQTQIDVLRGWIIDKNAFTMSDLAALTPSSMLTGTVISIANKVSEKINTSLGLPIYTQAVNMPAVNMPAVTMPAVTMPGLSIDIAGTSHTIIGRTQIFPQTNIFPATTLLPATTILPSFQIVPELPQLPNPFPSHDLTIPNLETRDVTNSLTNENEFIRFVDKDDRMLGAIRAQSINDFGADYFDGVYFVNVMSSIVGIDILSGFMGAIAEFTNLIDDYNNIGVEYSSGHGDYAEWLPRENAGELISSGDIVGVKGGKITKDLKNAEQVMAVSYRPIMLGNAPTPQEDQLGNKVAFLGQIPVKVMGAVNMGDFIVGKSEIPGYGVAVSPAKVTAEDLRLSVGRAWENSKAEGPKLINTLIGIQNGDYLNILKRSQDRLETMEKRLVALEEKMSVNKSNKSSKK